MQYKGAKDSEGSQRDLLTVMLKGLPTSTVLNWLFVNLATPWTVTKNIARMISSKINIL